MILGVDYTEADIRRFMSYVDKLPNGCWFWTGARSRGKGNKKWYGSFRLKKRTIRAHRFSCHALGANLPLPKGWHRGHSCDFSLCVCPEHVIMMTRENNQKRVTHRRRENASAARSRC